MAVIAGRGTHPRGRDMIEHALSPFRWLREEA
jgi:hypothetical protein